MAFHFSGSQLRVVQKYAKVARNHTLLSNSRFLIIEHILPTTEEFIRHLSENGAVIEAIFAKPYSIDNEVLSRLTDSYPIFTHSYAELEDEKLSIIDKEIRKAIDKSKLDSKKIILLDVGGYFLDPFLRTATAEDFHCFGGIIEDTTFGHNKYISHVNLLNIPVFSVARSVLKAIEARFVGKDAVIAVDNILRERGILLSGRKALVLGYGMIGYNIARSLKSADLTVMVYDIVDYKNLQAYTDGYKIDKLHDLLPEADIVFSATASQALSYEKITDYCKDGVIFASVGSKDTEFDIRKIKEQSIDCKQIGSYIKEYELPNSKRVRVLKEGTAVNFILKSLPVEILDLVFSEILICALNMLDINIEHKLGTVHVVSESSLNAIALDWLKMTNS